MILGFFKPPEFIDVSHEMIEEFSFFSRSFSFNKTLMLKIRTASGRRVAKRFNLTLLSEEKEKEISRILKKIIAEIANERA